MLEEFFRLYNLPYSKREKLKLRETAVLQVPKRGIEFCIVFAITNGMVLNIEPACRGQHAEQDYRE
jgi:hypothetical protein